MEGCCRRFCPPARFRAVLPFGSPSGTIIVSYYIRINESHLRTPFRLAIPIPEMRQRSGRPIHASHERIVASR